MWHPEGTAPYFGGTRALGDACVCLAGTGLTPGGFWGAGVSPAGYTQAAPRTGDLTPLPWQRLVKSPRAGRLLRAGGAGTAAREAAPRPPRSPPQHEPCPRQRLRLTPVLPAVPVSPRRGVTMLVKEYRICMPLTTEEVRGPNGHGRAGGGGWLRGSHPGDRFLPWEGHGDPCAVPSWHGWRQGWDGLGVCRARAEPSVGTARPWARRPRGTAPHGSTGHSRTGAWTSRRVWMPVARQRP